MTRIKQVVILGGGSAGWMSAIYLNRLLCQKGAQPVQITLVDSPDVEIIGVGESTFDQMRSFMSDMGIPEPDFLRATDATLKHGICFRNWLKGDDEYFHPFEFPQLGENGALIDHWISLHAQGKATRGIADSAGIQFQMAKAKKSPKQSNSKDYQGPLNYAYHLDAVLLGRYLRTVAIERGVQHLIGHCEQVHTDEQGFIRAIETREQGEIEADFFIDCTGFANVLMRAIDNTDFIDYTDKLLCDRAVASRIPMQTDRWEPRPYTTSTAHENGWIWDIDLYHRRGAGYVYSSQHSSENRAEEVLRDYLGDVAAELDVRHLRMRVGRLRNMWHRNCVAIGLSGGFIEPLESTGILFIDLALRFLGELMPSGRPAVEQIQRYNRVMGELVDNTRDFILLHYLLTQRDDSDFWRAYRQEIEPTDRLREKMELWRYKVPSTTDFSDAVSTFSAPSHSFIMYGMDWQHLCVPGSVAHLDNGFGEKLMQAMSEHQTEVLKQAPDHLAILQMLRKRSQFTF